MAYYSSRLQRRYERLSVRQTYLLLISSLVALVLIAMFGLPLIFSIAGKIGSLHRSTVPVTSQDASFVPTVPQFSEDLLATKSAQITISGVADAGVNVQINQNDNLVGTVLAGNDGSFSLPVNLSSGANNFTAVAVTTAGKQSGKSDVYTITYANTPPQLALSISDGQTATESPYPITGTIDSGDTVAVNEHLAIVSSDGTFSYLLPLSSGDNHVTVVVSDQAGNQTKRELTLKYNP